MKRQPYKYVEWIKYAYEFKDVVNVIDFDVQENYVNILANPNFPMVRLNLDKDLINQVYILPKSLQLYFFGLTWVGFCNFKDLETKKVLIKVLIAIFEYSKLNPNLHKDEMIWDDHALSERSCVLISLLEKEELSYLKDNIREHLELVSTNLDILLASKKWKGNNHRIFHLCAKYGLELIFRRDEIKASYFLIMIEDFFIELIDLETGLAVEQSVSYYNFDISLLKLVSIYVRARGHDFSNPRLNLEKLQDLKNKYLLALSFPDGTLPASGDTPLGLKTSPYNFPRDIREDLWRNLERIGHYRGASINDKFQYHVLSHNAESAHGHKSPLHIDLWVEGIGEVFIDSGGPYKYGDTLRYEWFINNQAHNTVTFLQNKPIFEKVIIANDFIKLKGVYISNSSYYFREIITSDKFLDIMDKITSETEWFVSFHFPDNLKVKELQSGVFEIVKDHNRITLSFSTSKSVDIKLVQRYITPAGGEKKLTPSIILKGLAGNYDVRTRVSYVFE